MATPDKEKNEMNTTRSTNQRLTTILLVLLIAFVALLVIGALVCFLMMGRVWWAGACDGSALTDSG